jgi:hypothetical protein
MDRSVLASNEAALEIEVSQYIGAMPFLWLDVDGPGGDDNQRGYIERNSIALLSNFQCVPTDAASPHWLGRYSDREKVRRSGLWNSNHVDEAYEPGFLEVLCQLVEKT